VSEWRRELVHIGEVIIVIHVSYPCIAAVVCVGRGTISSTRMASFQCSRQDDNQDACTRSHSRCIDGIAPASLGGARHAAPLFSGIDGGCEELDSLLRQISIQNSPHGALCRPVFARDRVVHLTLRYLISFQSTVALPASNQPKSCSILNNLVYVDSPMSIALRGTHGAARRSFNRIPERG
jgi:hypothetical protein